MSEMTRMLAALVLGLLVLGCGSLNPYPRDQNYRVTLQIADQNGDPLEGAAVWIDENLMDQRSEATFSTMGAGYPNEWQGWKYNFASPTLKVTIDYDGDTDEVGVIVSKVGYHTERFWWDVGEQEDTALFRRVVILEPLLPGA